MRLIDGRDLASMLAEGPLEPARAVRIVEQIATALDAAHQAGLIHRDVKPSNVLLDANEFAYLIDFGIARALEDTRLTSTGSTIGTFHYMAPERLGDHPDDDTAADIYALTCVLYECLTGQPPFAGTSMGALVAAHLNSPPPQPSATCPGLPTTLDEIIAKGMAKNPADRFRTAAELSVAALQAIDGLPTPAKAPLLNNPPVDQSGDRHTTLPASALNSLPDSAAGSVGPSPSPKLPHGRRSRHRAPMAIAAAVFVIALIAMAAVALRPDKAPARVAPPRAGGASPALNRAHVGDCLTWPEGTPDAATIVGCTDDHRFEVAESIDMRTFPGSEYGASAAPPSPARIVQINEEQCVPAVRRYLGAKFDPNSRFTVSMLWAGDQAWRQSGERRMLCGLQLPGPNNQQLAFKGKVADIDQSKVWAAGTCLGIDSTTNQPVDVPVDCAAPHAMEVTGTVNLAEKFPNALPSEAEQDAFIKDACTRMTDAYLAPITRRSTTLTLIYPTLSQSSWSAGSREVACTIGATLGNGDWATLRGSAKGQLLINGQTPLPLP